MHSLMDISYLYHYHFPTPSLLIGGLSASLVFLYFVLIRWSTTSTTKSKLQQPPQPPGSWPIIGHLHKLGKPNMQHITFSALADKYGPIYSLNLGLHKAIIVSSAEIVKEIFTTHDKVWSSRPIQVAIKHMGYDFAMSGFAPYGPYWREVTKIVNQEVLSKSRLTSLQHQWNSEINASMKELYEPLVNKNNARDNDSTGSLGSVVEMKRWFADLTLNMSVKMVAGKRYFGSKSSSTSTECDDKGNQEAWNCQRALRNFSKLLGIIVVADVIPFLGWLDFGGHEREMKNTARDLDVLMQKWLDEHKKKRFLSAGKGEKTAGNEQDFMDVMLSVLDDGKLDQYFEADKINKSTSLGLILGGSDTTMIMLVWALTLIVNNEHVLKKIHDELDMHVGRERQVNESDINNLVYLQAAVKETVRLYSGPMSSMRESTEDCVIAGYHVPAGTRLFVNIWKMHRDPLVWSNPLEFQPERFLTTHANVDYKSQNFEFNPFGSGRRSCPGYAFAIQVVHLALARLVQGFEFEKPTEAPLDMTETPGIARFKATPLELLVKPRLPSKLYA